MRFGYRDYAPAAGRFTAPDPIGYTGGDYDLWDYCVDDPVSKNDPSGLKDADVSDLHPQGTDPSNRKKVRQSLEYARDALSYLDIREAVRKKDPLILRGAGKFVTLLAPEEQKEEVRKKVVEAVDLLNRFPKLKNELLSNGAIYGGTSIKKAWQLAFGSEEERRQAKAIKMEQDWKKRNP